MTLQQPSFNFDLTGRVAMVTGGRRGIGAAIAQRLSAAGASVVLTAQSMDDGGLAETLALLRGRGGKAEALAFDLADPQARVGQVETASKFFGPLDILVNNAAFNSYETPLTMSLTARRKLFEINLLAPIDLIQQALPHMRAQNYGRFLHISSRSIEQPDLPYYVPAHFVHGIAVYAATKQALDRTITGLAAELYGTGVCANAIFPHQAAVTGVSSAAAAEALRRNPEIAEGIEMMAEAAMLSICGPLNGQVSSSRELLALFAAPLLSLDGASVIGDANTMPAL
jgi:NAD(P)-dependent dehydrogenase (short-subunit alcohol dehydrogenase family)